MLQIKRMPVGQIGTNCYLLEDTEAKTCAVIDPGDQPDDIDREIRKAGLKLTMILITHGHFDHVLGVPGLLKHWPGTPVYVHEKEVNWKNAGDQYMLLAPVEGIHTVKEGDTIDFGGASIQVLHTPRPLPRLPDLPGGGRALLRGHPLRRLLRPDGFRGGELWPDPPVPEAPGEPGGEPPGVPRP